MFEAEVAQTVFQNIDRDFIQPEISRRKTEGEFPQDFKIWECLIRLPKDRPSIVEFNQEFGWRVQPEMAPGTTLEMGRVVYAHEVQKLAKVLPPEVDGKRVAFIYLFWSGYWYNVLFDFSPNDPAFDPDQGEFELGKVIADHLQQKMIEIVVGLSRNAQAQLHQIGLWTATSLLPNPMARIIERVGNGEPEQARAILVDHCNANFIAELVETWKPIGAFDHRIELFRDAVFAHKERRFRLSIYALIPQVEGVIVDWLHHAILPEEIPWRVESRVKKFRDVIEDMPQVVYAYREAFESVSEFLLDGPPLQIFRKWLERIDPSFPGRNVVSHGRYVEELFTEENSIKLFLLLDTLCQFMMFYEARNQSQGTGTE
jgi:hypothetical protein